MNDHARPRRLLIAAMLVDTLGGGLLSPFELIYALKIAGLSLTSAALILSVAAAAGIAVGPVAGVAVDRIGPARVCCRRQRPRRRRLPITALGVARPQLPWSGIRVGR
jgi:MFS family permease